MPVVAPRPWREHLPPGAAADVGGLTAGGSLPAVWGSGWATTPDAPLLHQVGGGGPDAGRWVSAGELDERTRAAAATLASFGLRRGDRMLWRSGPVVDGIVANLAALRLGLVVVPVNPAYTERELLHVATDVRPAAAMAEAGAASALSAAGVPIVLGPGLRPAGGGTGASEVGRTGDFPLDDVSGDEPALIGYTSGTTGAPKGAVLSHANLLANSRALAVAWRVEADDRLVHALPVFHGHGLCAALYTTLLRGASAVLLPGFEARAVLDAAAAHQASLFFGVPTMYHRLAASGRAGELGRLRLAVSGSAPLAAELHGRLRVEGVDVLERYGMTETLLTVSNPVAGERRAGTVGFPLPGIEVQLDPENGELLVRGPQVFGGYFERPAATEGAFADGSFRTGDLAAEDDGYVRILGRAGDLVISGGFNVYPAEVEDVLLHHPGVGEVAVAGTPSDEWGEVVTAWIVPQGDMTLDPEELLAFAAAQLAPYKRPRLVRVVDELPRNAMGKVKRSELR